MPSTLAMGVGLVDVSVLGSSVSQNPQNTARWVTDAGVYIVTDIGDNVTNNGKQ